MVPKDCELNIFQSYIDNPPGTIGSACTGRLLQTVPHLRPATLRRSKGQQRPIRDPGSSNNDGVAVLARRSTGGADTAGTILTGGAAPAITAIQMVRGRRQWSELLRLLSRSVCGTEQGSRCVDDDALESTAPASVRSRTTSPSPRHDGRPAPRAPLYRSCLGNGLRALSTQRRETTMTTSAERMRALRERKSRGLRRLTIEVSEDDLRAIAKRGYEGAVTTDLDQQAQAVGLFLNDALLQI
jgi:hypothetical protein